MAGSKLESLGINKDSSEEKLFIKYVDESSYSKEQWIEALEEFAECLEEKGRAYQASSALEYIHCCAISSASHVIRPSLWSIVAQMLEDFGFEDRKDTC